MHLDKKQARNLRQRRDDLRSTVRAMAENNINMQSDITNSKIETIQALLPALDIKKRIDRKRKYIGRILNELNSILRSYCSQLEVLIEEAEQDCELDWSLFQSGEIETFEEFLETFIGHRKDFHVYSIKLARLSRDLSILDEIPMSSASSSEESDDY